MLRKINLFFSWKYIGNQGLLDQYLAIEWVNENIEAFGGDPTKVTLMGHGSGAAAVMMHMTSPRAVGKCLIFFSHNNAFS